MTPRSVTWLTLVAFAAGAATMTVELAAVRLLAPWYGTSSAVWTNVIGVVLVALSLGYLFGARASARPDPRRVLGLALIADGVATAWLPALARPCARLFLPEGLTLEEAGPALRWGSLASALLLFAPPAFALGTIAPLVAECVQRARALTAGAATGRVLCAGTLGSLVGTFATTYLFVPHAGLSATYLGAGAVLGGLGLPFLLAARARAPAAVGVCALAGALGLARLVPPSLAVGEQLLATRETQYQSVRVVEVGEGAARMRQLQVNESLGSFQSVWQPAAGILPDGYYYNAFALPAWWDLRPGPWRVLVLGLGAGTAWRVLEGALPEGTTLESTGIEIDPGVVELGRAWLDLAPAGRRDRIVASDVDARAALHLVPQRFDQVVLDAYQNQMEIPPQLASVEFFAEAAALLASGGWMVVNVGGFGLEDPVLDALARTMAAGFQQRVLAVRVPFSRNIALYARAGGEPPDPRDGGWIPTRGPLANLASAMSLEGASRWFDVPARAPLDDDRNPIEALQRESVDRARVGSP
ncbi:MAG: fused MFS/spermidine synthase [Planctomycetota bacterium]|nr:fused MFS/spermidine synthase [Planctomycetota bacterium]